jgi:hypothetical protein
LLPLFASKQTSARIDYLRQGGQLVDKKGTHNVKNLAEKYTKSDYSAYTRIGNGTENVCAYNCLRKRLQGIKQASESQSNAK